MSISSTSYAHKICTKVFFGSFFQLCFGFGEKFVQKMRAFNVDEIDGSSLKGGSKSTMRVIFNYNMYKWIKVKPAFTKDNLSTIKCLELFSKLEWCEIWIFWIFWLLDSWQIANLLIDPEWEFTKLLTQILNILRNFGP